MAYESLEAMVAAVASGVRPPERLTVAEAAEKYRYLSNPGSYVGYWDNAFAPYLVEPMEVLTSTDYTGMIFAGPARTGKSDVFFNWLLHTAVCDPADMMMVHMTMNVARDWSQKDLRRAFRHSKALGDTVAPGRSNQSTHDIRFISGMHLLVKWPTITELSGKTVGRNWIADYDRIPESIDGEGSAFSLTAKRAETFRRHGMTVAESSPGFDVIDARWQPTIPHEAPPVAGGVLALYNQGDRRRWYWRCPHCAEPFEPDFKHFVIPDSADLVEAAEATVLACPHCAGAIWHEGRDGVPGKHELNQTRLGNAAWVPAGQQWVPAGLGAARSAARFEGQALRSDLATFWLKGPAANFADWRGIVMRYLQAVASFERTADQATLRATTNTDQGLPYLPQGLEGGRLPEDIKAMARECGKGVVPPGVRFLVATVDVQKSRFECQVQGFGYGNDIVVIDRWAIKKSERLDEDGDRLPVRPASYIEDWRLLIDEVFLRTYPLGDGSGRHMRIRMVGCDSGGAAAKKNDSSVTGNAYEFYRLLRHSDGSEFPAGLHHRLLLLKGGSTQTAPRVKLTYPDSERADRHAGARGNVPILMLNTTALKDQIDALLDRKAPGGGRIEFADWLPDSFWNEMVAETRTAQGWERVTARNEAWDLLVYAWAVALFRPIRAESLDWEDPPRWAAEWDDNDMVFHPDGAESGASKAPGRSLADLAADLA